MHNFNGKNTIEVAYTLAAEFVRLFGVSYGTEADLRKVFLPRGRACSWSVLDRSICQFAKRFCDSWEQNQDKIEFLDSARFTLQELPQKLDYLRPNDQQEYESFQEGVRNFTTCSLCWRTVLQAPLERKTPLCHVHDLPSTHPSYRKRARLKKRVELTKLTILKSLPPLFSLKKQGAELNAYIMSLCLNEDSPLPYLKNYLASSNAPLSTPEDILRALETPRYEGKLSDITRQIWAEYFQDRAGHFRLNYIALITAEAWLKVEAENKHGGKRR